MILAINVAPIALPISLVPHISPFVRPCSSYGRMSTASASVETSCSDAKTLCRKNIHPSRRRLSVRSPIARMPSSDSAIISSAPMIHGRRRPIARIVTLSISGAQMSLNVQG